MTGSGHVGVVGRPTMNSFSVLAEASPQASPALRPSPCLQPSAFHGLSSPMLCAGSPALCPAAGAPQALPVQMPSMPGARPAGTSILTYLSESVRVQADGGHAWLPESAQPSSVRVRSISGSLSNAEQFQVSSGHWLSHDSQELPQMQFVRSITGPVMPAGSGTFMRLDDASPASSVMRQISSGHPPQQSVLAVAQHLAAAHGAPPMQTAPAHMEAHPQHLVLGHAHDVTPRGSLVLQAPATHPAAAHHHEAVPHASPVMQVGAPPRLSRTWTPSQLGSGCASAGSAVAAGQPITTVLSSPAAHAVMSSPAHAVLSSPVVGPLSSPVVGPLSSPVVGPVMCRTVSNGAAHAAPLGSPQAWTTVTTRRRTSRASVPGPAASGLPPDPAALTRLTTAGDCIDLYYTQKEEFFRGWTREAKQSRSFKAKKQTDYQVEKRKNQSMRDKASMANFMAGEAEDAF